MKGLKKVFSITMIAAILCSFSISASAVESSASPMASSVTAEQAVDSILSEGMTAENIILTKSDISQLGYFNAPNDMNLPFNEGIVLTTGYVSDIFKEKGASSSFNGNGNSYLTELYQNEGFSSSTYDAVELSFDLVPTKAALTFDFFFASTEYNQPNPTEPETTVSVPQTTQPTQPTTKAQATVDESVKVVDSANVQTGFNTSIIVISMILIACAGIVWFTTKRKVD